MLFVILVGDIVMYDVLLLFVFLSFVVVKIKVMILFLIWYNILVCRGY